MFFKDNEWNDDARKSLVAFLIMSIDREASREAIKSLDEISRQSH